MEAYQERVVLEKKELDDKLSKLNIFIGGSLYLTLSAIDQVLLHRQAAAMTDYSATLSERISRF